MSELATFNESTYFSFVDNPPVACLSPADAVKTEYKDTPVRPCYLAAGSGFEDRGAQELLLPLPQSQRYLTTTLVADGNCYYRSMMYAYIEKLITVGATAVKAFRDMVANKVGHYKTEDSALVSILSGHLDQLHERLMTRGTDAALQLLLRMITFSEHFDTV